MKLESYSPQVSGNVIRGNVSSPTLQEAYGGNTAGTNAMVAALGKAAEVAQAQWMKGENERVIKGVNIFHRKMNSFLYDEQNGIVNTMQGEKAQGLQAAYEAGNKKIMEEALKESGIESKYAMQAFMQQMDSDNTANLALIDKFQRKGMEEHATNLINEDYQNTVNLAVRNPDDITNTLAGFEKRTRALLSGNGISEEEINVKLNQYMNNLAIDWLATQAEAGDYETGLKAIPLFRVYGVNENVLKRQENALKSKKVVKETGDETRDFLTKNQNLLNGTGLEAWAAFQKEHPLVFQKTGIATGNPEYDKFDEYFLEAQKETGVSDDVIQWAKAMGFQESSFNPNALSSDGYDGRGIFQFDADTARDAGLDPNDRYDARKNILAGVRLLARRLKKYDGDIEKAMLAHNGGEGGLEAARRAGYLEHVKDKKDLLYGSAMSPEEQAKYVEKQKNAFIATWTEMKRERKEMLNAQMDNVQRTLFEMMKNQKSSSDMLIYLDGVAEQYPELKSDGSFRSLYASAMAGQQKEIKGSNGSTLMKAADRDVASLRARIGNDIMNEHDLNAVLAKMADEGVGLTPVQLDDVKKEVYRASHGEGKYSIDIPETMGEIASEFKMSEKDLSPLFPYLKNYVRQRAWEYKEKNKVNPGYAERIKWFHEGIRSHSFGEMYWMTKGFGREYAKANSAQLLRAGIEGVPVETDDHRALIVTEANGRKHYIPKEDFNDIIAGTKSLNDYGG